MGLVFVQNSPFSVLHQKLALIFRFVCLAAKFKLFFFFFFFVCFLFCTKSLVFWVPVLLQNSSFCFDFQGSCAPTRRRRRKKRRKRKWVCSSFVIDRLLQWENTARQRPRM